MGYTSVKTEQLAHHLKFLKACQKKSIILQGLLSDKTINPIKSHCEVCVNGLHVQIKQIFTNASKQILATLISGVERDHGYDLRSIRH